MRVGLTASFCLVSQRYASLCHLLKELIERLLCLLPAFDREVWRQQRFDQADPELVERIDRSTSVGGRAQHRHRSAGRRPLARCNRVRETSRRPLGLGLGLRLLNLEGKPLPCKTLHGREQCRGLRAALSVGLA